MPRGARRVDLSVGGGRIRCASPQHRVGKKCRGGDFSAWNGALRGGGQGSAGAGPCNENFTASQFLSQCAIPVRARGPPPPQGWALDCIRAPIAQKTHANPVGGRGISAFSPRFFSSEGIFVGWRGVAARAGAGGPWPGLTKSGEGRRVHPSRSIPRPTLAGRTSLGAQAPLPAAGAFFVPAVRVMAAVRGTPSGVPGA
ncbi:hypothetical protein SAMN05421672_110161 [Pseudomonas flexibilis]|uniref:Uncharacterized protein n=1 Tax=Pseudomonas flexibilis TaxID=706570 RepID=A0A1N6VZN6_9PSED|nr:hypothetical protein SAMN05421672_110161 [Pseudomonas flexibilis]